jgi:hypothetical protein
MVQVVETETIVGVKVVEAAVELANTPPQELVHL